MLTAIVGINWGDEGKGRMVDLLSENAEIVVRYQGGNNAGHTVVNDRGEFKLNLLPSGILRPEVVNVLGTGMVIDICHLAGEMGRLRDAGVEISPKNLKISDKATICMPYHVLLDGLEEARLADKKFGSTKRGIAPVYSDKYSKKSIRMGDLLFPDTLPELVSDHLADGDRKLILLDEESISECDKRVWSYEAGAWLDDRNLRQNGTATADLSKNPTFVYRFTGTELAMYTNIKSGTVSFTYTVDGGEAQTGTFKSHNPTPVVSGLSSGEHVIRITPSVSEAASVGISQWKISLILTRDESKQTTK